MCLRRKKKGKYKVLYGRFCLHDSETEQRALKLLHIYCSNVNSYCSAPESNKQNPPDRNLDLSSFFVISLLFKTFHHHHQARVFLLVSGQLCSYVGFQLLVERISFACIR